MKILIIGSTGFIGRHLVAELAQEHELVLLHRGNHPADERFQSIHADRKMLREVLRRPAVESTDFNYDQDVTLDTRKIRLQLGYSERYSREESLRDTIEFISNHSNTES